MLFQRHQIGLCINLMAHVHVKQLQSVKFQKYLGMDMNLVSVDGILCPFKNFSYFTGVVILLVSLCVLYRFTRSCIQSNTMKHSFRAMSTSKCCRKWDYPSQISQKMATPVVWMRVGYQLVGSRLFNLNIKFLICINKQLP